MSPGPTYLIDKHHKQDEAKSKSPHLLLLLSSLLPFLAGFTPLALHVQRGRPGQASFNTGGC